MCILSQMEERYALRTLKSIIFLVFSLFDSVFISSRTHYIRYCMRWLSCFSSSLSSCVVFLAHTRSFARLRANYVHFCHTQKSKWALYARIVYDTERRIGELPHFNFCRFVNMYVPLFSFKIRFCLSLSGRRIANKTHNEENIWNEKEKKIWIHKEMKQQQQQQLHQQRCIEHQRMANEKKYIEFSHMRSEKNFFFKLRKQ